jgi:pimeloyl-ACP methyl ester carboxylesterase
VVALLFYLGGGWYFSGLIDDRALDGESRRAALAPDFDLEVLSVERDSLTIRVTDDPGSIVTDGVFGIAWAGGYGRLGRILELTRTRVVREFELVEGVAPQSGTAAQLDSRSYRSDPSAVGLPFEEVTFEGELGDYPAWFVPGSGTSWVILVHGNSLTREDALRMLPIVAGEGYPALVVSYRNDPGAPEDPSGKLRYGATEWRDLEAAVRYALDAGASDVVLVGFSMGGAIVASFLERSALAGEVRAAILEAPMLDFGRTVDLNASREELPLLGIPVPSSLTSVARWMAGIRFGVDWGELDYLSRADELDVPILLIHGVDDEDVPIDTSEALAEARPDLVTFVRVADAAHMEAWNVDPEAYATNVVSFLQALDDR